MKDWGDRVEQLVQQVGPPLTSARVLASCDSTQDHARALGLGVLVVAQRQVAGRGQRGNQWADTGDDGLAFSLCLAATAKPARSVAVAQAIVDALDPLVPGRLQVKHPNDVLLDGRKLAGVLIEQADGLAVIGVGINVGQVAWPPPLKEIAVSLAQAGIWAHRLDILAVLVPEIVAAWMGPTEA